MIDLARVTANRLRERATHCRELALDAQSAGIAAELYLMADDYDRDALRLESRSGTGGRYWPSA